MVSTTSKITATVFCCFLLSFSAVSFGGTLDGHASALSSGTSPYANASLSGTLDWAVFSAADFDTAFGGAGYASTPGELVYAYQLLSSGTLGTTGWSMSLGGGALAGSGGDFSGGGVSGNAITSNFVNDFFVSFTNVSASSGVVTDGMAYSSPNAPLFNGAATVVDGGTNAAASGVALPGPVAIPEPASCLLACMGMLLLLVWRRQDR